MDKYKRLNDAYYYLIGKQVVTSQTDVAKMMGAARGNVSQALKGVPSVLTDNFCMRFCRAFPDISLQWLLSGEGEMLQNAPPKPTTDQTADAHVAPIEKQEDALAYLAHQLADIIARLDARERNLTDREQILAQREQSLTTREQSLTNREQTMTTRERQLADRLDRLGDLQDRLLARLADLPPRQSAQRLSIDPHLGVVAESCTSN